jgi:hypothetical protein
MKRIDALPLPAAQAVHGRRRIGARFSALAVASLLTAPGAALAYTGNTLAAGAVLVENDTLYSPSGTYRLALDSTGNLAVYTMQGTVPLPIWATNTAGAAGTYFFTLATSTCTLDLYQGSPASPGAVLWSQSPPQIPPTPGGCFLVLDDTGTLTLDASTASKPVELWSSAVILSGHLDATYVFHPAGTDNVLLFNLDPNAVSTVGQVSTVTNSLVLVSAEHGIPIVLPVLAMTFTGTFSGDEGIVTAADGTLVGMPTPQNGPWPGSLLGMAVSNTGTLHVKATTGADYGGSFNQLPLAATHNYLALETEYAGEGYLPAITVGSTNIVAAVNSTVGSQAQMLLDPTDPALYVYGGLLGTNLMGNFNDVGLALSAHQAIPFAPTTTADLPAGTVPSFTGSVYAGGSVTLEDIDSTLTGAVTVDLGPLASPRFPTQIGANASLAMNIPFLTDWTNISLNYANATLYARYDSPTDFAVDFDAIGDSSGLVPHGLFAQLVVPEAASTHVFGQITEQAGTFMPSSYVLALGVYTLRSSLFTAMIPGAPSFGDVSSEADGALAASVNGVDVSFSTSQSLLALAPFNGRSVVGAFVALDGTTFNVIQLGEMSYGGVTLGNAVLQIANAGVSASGVMTLGGLSVGLTGSITAEGGTLTGSGSLSIPLNLAAGAYAYTGFDATICGMEQVTDAAVCGYVTLTSAAYCGASTVTSAAQCGTTGAINAAECGTSVAANAVVCGTTTAANAAVCGTSTVTNGAECGWDTVLGCVSSLFSDCHTAKTCSFASTCTYANTCNVPNYCTYANTCSVPNTCNAAASCAGVSSCTWDTALGNALEGTVTGTLDVTVGSSGTSFVVGGSGSLQYCPSSGPCTTLTSDLTYQSGTLQICLDGLPGAQGVICINP